jgi:hypothetical protein
MLMLSQQHEQFFLKLIGRTSMEDILKQDIFFFVTTISVIVFTILFGVILIYAVRIFYRIDFITKKAKLEVELFSSELAELRKNIKNSGFKLKHILDFFKHLSKKRK